MCEIVSTVELVFDHVLDDLHLDFHVSRNVRGVSDHVDTEVVDCRKHDFFEFILEDLDTFVDFEFILSLPSDTLDVIDNRNDVIMDEIL